MFCAERLKLFTLAPPSNEKGRIKAIGLVTSSPRISDKRRIGKIEGVEKKKKDRKKEKK